MVLSSGDQRSHHVLASFRFAGFIFILYWFSVAVDEWPEGKSEATERLMGHKERFSIMEPCQSLTRPRPSKMGGSISGKESGLDLRVSKCRNLLE